MNKFRKVIFVLLGAFGLIAGLATIPAFAADKANTTKKTAKVDVNNATDEELEELPGIGAGYAKKIIDGRPYKTVDDLINAGIPQKTVDKIKDSIKFGKVKTAQTPKKTRTKAATTTEDTGEETAKAPPRKGMVWVNTDSNIYHKEGDRWYGNTKYGKFMTQ